MIGTIWWNHRRARLAAKHLQRSLGLLESTAAAFEPGSEVRQVPTEALKKAANEAKLARKTIEELPELSFTTQSRFFRLFEWLEECMDYAGESIQYEEYEAAKIDLCRSRRGVNDAVTLLTTHAGIKAPKTPFRWVSRRQSQKSVERQAEPKRTAEVIYLLQPQETPPPPQSRMMLM